MPCYLWTLRWFSLLCKRALPPEAQRENASSASPPLRRTAPPLPAARWKLTPELAAQMVAHARVCYPREACGILAGTSDCVLRHYPARNVAPGNERFLLDPEQQQAIFADIAQRQWKLLAIYHSHPQRDATPSLNDLRLASYPQVLMVIISLADWGQPVIRGYRLCEGQSQEISLGLEQSPEDR
jgi:[CysO sulfur-carrier protein]-S-L-cysteine hydrolase